MRNKKSIAASNGNNINISTACCSDKDSIIFSGDTCTSPSIIVNSLFNFLSKAVMSDIMLEKPCILTPIM